MGCFSYLCKSCGGGIQSSSFTGDHCVLFLLKDGKVVEEMKGRYNSYGAVFTKSLKKSKEWKKMDWSDIVDLHFDGDEANGIAAWHTKCYDGSVPTTQSEDDPNQGWGDDHEEEQREFYHEFE